MTIEEYRENHGLDDAEPRNIQTDSEPRCPVCGSDECTVIYTQDGKAIGCDVCIEFHPRCPHCGSEAYDTLFYRADYTPIGCDRCVREVNLWEWDDA